MRTCASTAQHYDSIPVSQVDSHSFNRFNIPDQPLVGPDDDLEFVVGIGGHHAPPNVRLFSYVLPAIELAQKNGEGKHSLTLTSSVNAALRYNYPPDPRTLNKVHYHTREKLACILAFIEEFFPNVFSEGGEYYGNIQNDIPDSAWVDIWNEISSVRPDICNNFLRQIGRGDSDGVKAYAIRHAFWFLDYLFEDDQEYQGDIRIPTVSVGSEKENLFNSIGYVGSGHVVCSMCSHRRS